MANLEAVVLKLMGRASVKFGEHSLSIIETKQAWERLGQLTRQKTNQSGTINTTTRSADTVLESNLQTRLEESKELYPLPEYARYDYYYSSNLQVVIWYFDFGKGLLSILFL